MPRARALAVALLLVSYGAVGARQPAVRSDAPLPVPAAVLAQALDLEDPDRSRLVLDIVRVIFDAPDGGDEADAALRQRVGQVLASAGKHDIETVPLPLDPSIWRETILARQVSDRDLVATILGERQLALLYHGLAALDDDTLAWLGPDRETLQHLMRHPGAFAAFGRSIRVRAGRVVVPGGPEFESLFEAVVGGSVDRPGAFVRKLFGDADGRLAFFYDTVSHLDDGRRRFALAAALGEEERRDRVRALIRVFERIADDWRVEDRPFWRPQLDPALMLALVIVTPDGRLVGPASREMWDRIFDDDGTGGRFNGLVSGDARRFQGEPVDAAWLASRIHQVPLALGRRRLDTFLLAQRLFGRTADADGGHSAVARAAGIFPALMLTLERAGATAVPVMIAAASRAQSLDDIRNETARGVAILAFQSLVGIIERAVSSGALAGAEASGLIESLVAVESTDRGYQGRLGQWIRRELLPHLEREDNVSDPAERAVLSAMAGIRSERDPEPVVEWEGYRYRVSPPAGELQRLLRVRERQGGPSLDTALDATANLTRTEEAATVNTSGPASNGHVVPSARDRRAGDSVLAQTLSAMLYAAHLGDPEGPALAAGNVALRHDLEAPAGPRGSTGRWQIPKEEFGSPVGWRVTGSLLGLDVALAGLAPRRLDFGEMPAEPRLTANERHTMSLTVASMRPWAMTDATRDEIAAALSRGRARLAALGGDRVEIERVAREAGLSAWRREALAWTIEHERERAADQLALVELLWLGAPRAADSIALDPWGAAVLPLTGCLCLELPRPGEWGLVAGRPAAGLLAARSADVTIRVAEVLAELRLPASLAPGVTAFAMQEVMDRARPAYHGDWLAFSRAVRGLPRERIIDYIAALTAGGPLQPVRAAGRPQ